MITARVRVRVVAGVAETVSNPCRKANYKRLTMAMKNSQSSVVSHTVTNLVVTKANRLLGIESENLKSDYHPLAIIAKTIRSRSRFLAQQPSRGFALLKGRAGWQIEDCLHHASRVLISSPFHSQASLPREAGPHADIHPFIPILKSGHRVYPVAPFT